MYLTIPGVIDTPDKKVIVLQLFKYGKSGHSRKSDTLLIPESIYGTLCEMLIDTGTYVDLQHNNEVYTIPEIMQRRWSNNMPKVHGGDALHLDLQAWSGDFPKEISLCPLEIFDSLEADGLTDSFKVSMLGEEVDDLPTKSDLEMCKTYSDAYILMLAAMPALVSHPQEVLSLYMEFCLKLKDFDLSYV